jgi:hypothetical protein
LLKEYNENSFNYKKFLFIIIALVVTLVIDTSIVKVYDLVDKYFIPIQGKIILFSIDTSLCLILQFVLIKYVINHIQSLFKRHQLNKRLNVSLWYRISLISLFTLGTLMGLLIFQQFYNNYYETLIPIFIVIISYGTAAGFIIRLSMLFISWYKSNHSSIVLLYFISTLLIAFNLVVTAIITDVKINDRPDKIRELVGGSIDISFGKYVFLDNIYTISSIMSFISIWITTALLMNSYRDKLIVNAIVYWIILSIPLVYFLVNYLYKFILTNMLSSYLAIDPITVTIILTAFLSLSKPIGGLTFAIAFWKISKITSYEKNIKTYMIISGWGILLIFGADQAVVQSQLQSPYPPFGLATLTVLIMASFLVLLGIYNSAIHVSANNQLRKSIHKHALESRLLGLIGHAEMEKEIEKTVKKITQDKDRLEIDTEQQQQQPIELDENELKKYVDLVIIEVKRGRI